MQYGIGVEYALHCLLYLIGRDRKESLSIKKIAQFQGVSETYLSKTFTKLKKAGIVRATTGVKGGYELAQAPEDISFWDVIEAIEGNAYNFQCTGILKTMATNTEEEIEYFSGDCPCLIKHVMHDAEDHMRTYLKSKTLVWLNDELDDTIPKDRRDAVTSWFND